METVDLRIDSGKAFDWGRTSELYSRYRDIYPKEFYEKIVERKLCISGQRVLDLGTGTGVLPRNMYEYKAEWVGTDISENQIEAARKLSQGMNIEYRVMSAEQLDFEDNSFDVVTACQCFWYFDHNRIVPILHRILKKDGRFLVLCMEWLPEEDKIAAESERLILKYNPKWSGAGERMHPIDIPDCYLEKFELVYSEAFPIDVRFTRESWHGRMKACRGTGASLTEDELKKWEKEHIDMLNSIAPEEFDVHHFIAIAELKKR